MNTIQIPENNISSICRLYAESTGGTIRTNDGLFTTYTAPGFFYTRNVIEEAGHACPEEVIARVLKGTEEGLPALTTFTEQLMPAGTKALFESSGFSLMLTQHGMILDGGFDVDEAVDPHIDLIGEAEITEWVDAMMKGFAHEKEREDVIYENMIKIPSLYFLIYREDGKALGTTILQLTKDYAGLHEVSVDPACQRRGIAGKLVTRALQMAAEKKVCGVTLQASDMGRPVYEKFGFRKVSEIHSMMMK